MKLPEARKSFYFFLIVLLTGGAFIGISTLLIEPVIERTLRTEVRSLLQGVYTFDFRNVRINLIAGDITVNGITLTPATQRIQKVSSQENIYTIRIERIHINDMGYLPFFKKKLQLTSIEIDHPDVFISNGKNSKTDSFPSKVNFYGLIESKIRRVEIGTIRVEGGRMHLMKSDDSNNARFAIQNFSAVLQNLEIDSTIATKNAGWPSWEDLRITSVNNHYELPDKKHALHIPKLFWSDKDCVLVISQISFFKKTGADSSSFNIKIQELRASGINIDALLHGQIDVQRIIITEPQTRIVVGLRAKSQDPPSIDTILKRNFPQTSIGLISIKNGDLYLENSLKKFKVYVHHFNHSYDSIQVMVNSGKQKEFAKPGIKFEANNIRVVFPDSLYVLTGENFRVVNSKQEVTVAHVNLQPQYGKKEFSRKKGVQSERMELICPVIKMSGIDVYEMLLQQKIVAASVEIPRLILRDYRDKSYPEVRRIKLLPGVAIMQMDIYLKIDILKIGEAELRYDEKLPDNKGINRIEFTKINAQISNITNDPVASRHPMVLAASGFLYGKGKITLKGIFQLRSKWGNFRLHGSSGGFEMKYLNEILESSAALTVNTGMVDSMSFSMQGNDTLATGNMNLYYHDLKFNVLNRKTSTKHGLKAEIGTFLMDKVLVKSENPDKSGTRTGEIAYRRDRYKSIFNFLAKSVVSGMLSTVAPAVAELKNIKEQKEQKEQKD